MFRKILVPTDGSVLSQNCVQHTVKFAAETAAQIVFIYARPLASLPYLGLGAISDPHLLQVENERLDSAAEAFLAEAKACADEAGVSCECVKASGDQPWQLIVQTAEVQGCDAIFMASHGRSGISGLLLGSETQKVLTHSSLPVLVYR